jgi:hypothetical protein
MLDMEYEECVRATKGYDFKDYDSGPTEDADATPAKNDAEAAKAYGYAHFASVKTAAGRTRQGEGEGA